MAKGLKAFLALFRCASINWNSPLSHLVEGPLFTTPICLLVLTFLQGVVLGLFVGIVVLVAETGLFIIKVDRMDTSQSKRAYRFLPATVRARGDTPSTPIPKEALQQIRSHPPLEETQQSITADAVAPQAQSSAKSKNEVKKRKDTKRKQ